MFDAGTHRADVIAATETIDLRPAGDARLYFVPEHGFGDQPPVLLVDRDRMRLRGPTMLMVPSSSLNS